MFYGQAPEGAIVIIRRISPEIMEVLPHIAGLVAERGNLAGHAATLRREFKVPSYTREFLAGNYSFTGGDTEPSAGPATPP